MKKVKAGPEIVRKAGTGRYTHLNEKWRPLYRLGVVEPGGDEETLFLMCIQVMMMMMTL